MTFSYKYAPSRTHADCGKEVTIIGRRDCCRTPEDQWQSWTSKTDVIRLISIDSVNHVSPTRAASKLKTINGVIHPYRIVY